MLLVRVSAYCDGEKCWIAMCADIMFDTFLGNKADMLASKCLVAWAGVMGTVHIKSHTCIAGCWRGCQKSKHFGHFFLYSKGQPSRAGKPRDLGQDVGTGACMP